MGAHVLHRALSPWPDLDEEPQLISPGVDPDMISFFAKKLGADEPETDGDAPLRGMAGVAERSSTRGRKVAPLPSSGGKKRRA